MDWLLEQTGAKAAADQVLLFLTLGLGLALLTLMMVAWLWYASLPGPVKSVITLLAAALAFLVAYQLVPWAEVREVGTALAWEVYGLWKPQYAMGVIAVLALALFVMED